MPPNAEVPKAGAGNERFLAACIKHAKEKVVVDFEALAQELGMSKGGAANKYRAIMKQLEDEKATDGDANSNGTVKPKTPTKRKATPKKSVKTEDNDDANGATTSAAGSDAETPSAKKSKVTAKKGTAKSGVKKVATKGKKVKQDESEAEEDVSVSDGDVKAEADSEEDELIIVSE